MRATTFNEMPNVLTATNLSSQECPTNCNLLDAILNVLHQGCLEHVKHSNCLDSLPNLLSQSPAPFAPCAHPHDRRMIAPHAQHRRCERSCITMPCRKWSEVAAHGEGGVVAEPPVLLILVQQVPVPFTSAVAAGTYDKSSAGQPCSCIATWQPERRLMRPGTQPSCQKH